MVQIRKVTLLKNQVISGMRGQVDRRTVTTCMSTILASLGQVGTVGPLTGTFQGERCRPQRLLDTAWRPHTTESRGTVDFLTKCRRRKEGTVGKHVFSTSRAAIARVNQRDTIQRQPATKQKNADAHGERATCCMRFFPRSLLVVHVMPSSGVRRL